MKHIYAIFVLLVLGTACSDFDEQGFTVLLPDAGEDQVVFTAESGTTIQLNASESTDVNDLGFDVEWVLEQSPEGSNVTLNDPTSLTPTFEVTDETGGRFVWRLILKRGDQVTQDLTVVDVNPANAQVLLVNAIDGADTATLSVASVDINGAAVAALDTDVEYYNIDLNIAESSAGTIALAVAYGDQNLTLDAELEALKSYSLYVVGTTTTPELLLIERRLNQNSTQDGFVGLGQTILSPGVDNVVLFIDATNVGFGEAPLDAVLQAATAAVGTFGVVSYKESSEVALPANSINPLPIWATVNGQRISNSTIIGLPAGVSSNFGTFALLPDSTSEFGNTLVFINNSELLPE